MFKNDLKGSQLEIEITETILMEYNDKALAKFNQLSEMEISIAIDDFGTGYSSLAQLGQSLPVNVLKIDKSFIDKIELEFSHSMITKSIIDIGHNLGLNVIAEGVETQAQLEFLKKNHCDFVQGYYFARPMRADDLQKHFLEGCSK